MERSSGIDRVLFSEADISRRVNELAGQISQDFGQQEVLVVGVLRGVVVFLADLLRALTVPVSLDFLAISSYGHSTDTSGVVRLLKDLDESITGRHLLLVEDIVATGLTLRYILKVLRARGPASLRVCTLLDRPSHRLAPVEPDYVGFTIPSVFVVGYGLDYRERYRNLPYIALFSPPSETPSA